MTSKTGDTFIIHYKTIDDDESNIEIRRQPSSEQKVQENQPPAVNEDAQKEIIKSFFNDENCLNGVIIYL